MANFIRPRFLAVFLVLYLSACGDSGAGNPEPTPPSDGKTYLKVTNNTPYAVNVYINDPPLYGKEAPDTIRTVQGGTPDHGASNQWELQPTAEGSNGETLYFEYLIPVGEQTIPFYPNTATRTRLVKLEEGKVNETKAPELSSIDTDSSFVLIRNNSDANIWMQQGIMTVYPFDAKLREIATNSGAVYILENVSSLSGLTIGDTGTRKDFPTTALQKGVVYTFLYDNQNGPQLFLQEPFDPNMNDMIWTIPTSADTGRYFSVGLFQSRANVDHGYILVGRVSYSADVAGQPQAGSSPYFAAIAPNGTITERKIIIRNNPSGLYLRRFIDDGDELVFTGQAYYDSTDGTPFILGTDYAGEMLFYMDDFLKEVDLQKESKNGWFIAKSGDRTYAIGGDLYYDWGETRVTQAYLDKVTRTSFDEVEYERLWIQPSDDASAYGSSGILYLTYDSGANSYLAVVGYGKDDDSSLLYIIDAADGSQKPEIRLDRHTINMIFQRGGDYYAAGTYYGVSKYRGFIRKLNIESGTWGGDPMWMDDPPKYPNGATMVYNVVQDKDGSIVVSGACVENASDQDNREVGIPWMVKYDIDSKTKKWERVYENHRGYYIYSTHLSSLGSYLLELYNEMTSQSTLVSTDLLGNLGGQEKAKPAVPRDATFTVKPPDSLDVSAVVASLVDVEMEDPEPLTLTKGQSAVIRVKGQWASYQWYVDGSPVAATSTYTFASAARAAGVWTVMAVVTGADGVKRSAWRRVIVTN